MSTPSSIADFLNRLGPVAVAKLDAYPIKTNVERSVTGDMVNSALQDLANLLSNLLADKMDEMTVDSTPTAGSSNLVTSGGVANAITAGIASALSAYMTSAQVTQAIATALLPYAKSADVATEVATQISAALAGYSTTAQMQAAIADAIGDALANYSTTQQMNFAISNAINNALVSYSTTAEVGQMITNALTLYPSIQDMNSAIASALTGYLSAQQTYAAIADALTDYVTTTSLAATLASYYTKNEMDAALALKQDQLTFDEAPTEGSDNPVKSGGIYDAIAAAVVAVEAWVQGAFARIDGYYQTLTAGAAENLVGHGTTPAVISFRPAGGTQDIGTGAASIAKIKGRTDGWNELFPNLNDGNLYVQNGTKTYDASDKSLHIVPNSGSTQTNLSYSGHKLIQGHIYFLVFELKTENGGQYTFLASQWAGGSFFAQAGAGVYKNNITRFTAGQYSSSYEMGISMYNSTDAFDIRNVKYYDATLQYGAGREPATAAAFLSEYPEALTAPYNAGKLVPNKVTALVTTGYNLFNPATGEAHLVGGQKIQICGTYGSATIDGEAVVFDANGYFTPTRDCVMVVVGGNATDTDVHFSHSGIRDYGTANYLYEPYWTSSLNLDHSKIYGKLNGEGEMVQIAPYGFRGVGTNCDEVDVVRKEAYIRRAWVDLGSLTWNAGSVAGVFLAQLSGQALVNMGYKPNDICAKYIVGATVNSANAADKTFYQGDGNNFIFFKDTAYAAYTPEQVKTALDGVMLDYQLATPLHYTDLMYSEDGGQTFIELPSNYRVDDFGTERRLPDGLVDGAPASTPLVADVRYSMNAVDVIRNLPRNYISKESMENFLAALVSAGVLASYTITYDDTNSVYDFTVVKAE